MSGGTPAERFALLAEEFGGRPEVTPPGAGPRGFGADALKVGGSIFAMLTRDKLVLKLPRVRVVELLSSGEGRPFDAGKGTPMKEWVVVADDDPLTWRDLAEEAYTFVSARRGARG